MCFGLTMTAFSEVLGTDHEVVHNGHVFLLGLVEKHVVGAKSNSKQLEGRHVAPLHVLSNSEHTEQ